MGYIAHLGGVFFRAPELLMCPNVFYCYGLASFVVRQHLLLKNYWAYLNQRYVASVG